MNADLRILIAYDGSPCADAALNDLKRAGLPRSVAQVLTVADVWIPPPGSEVAAIPDTVAAEVQLARKHAIENEEHARELAEKAALQLRESFPTWLVSVASCQDAPWWGILGHATEFKPDLIVVGSHGRGALGRLVLGSVSQRIAAEAPCSVRVARGRMVEDAAPPRIVVAVDGSDHSQMTVDRVAARAWPSGAAVHVVAIVNSNRPWFATTDCAALPGWALEDYEKIAARLREFASSAVAKLRGAGLLAAPLIAEGDPRWGILHEAERWGADCIFVGAHGHTKLQRMLGTVSQHVAARAHCSVEIVR